MWVSRGETFKFVFVEKRDDKEKISYILMDSDLGPEFENETGSLCTGSQIQDFFAFFHFKNQATHEFMEALCDGGSPDSFTELRINNEDYQLYGIRIGQKTLLLEVSAMSQEVKIEDEELLRITMESIGDGVVTTDGTGRITYLNQAASEVTGWSLDEIEGRLFSEVFRMRNEYTNQKIQDIVGIVLSTGQKQELANHTVLEVKNGIDIPIEDSAEPILDEHAKLHGVVVVFRDVTLAREKKEKIEYLSYHDPLTGLYNRRFYYDFVKRMNVEEKYPLGVIMGDMNGLKIINDVFGHEMGDRLLKIVSETINEYISEEDIAVRWGGDEFIIVMPEADVLKLEMFIKMIKERLKDLKVNKLIEVSVSFGYVLIKEETDTLDSLLRQAEEMMYQTKLLESKSMRGSMVNALMMTLDERSAETRAHTSRLTETCLAIAGKMGLHAVDKNRLSLLSLLHDIGKIGIPDRVLSKPGPLTPAEWEIMKTHSEIGYRIASNVPELAAIAEEILHHHEKWDGSGYPKGLKEGEIPLNCRILAVVDAFDAMTNDRVYRNAVPEADAVEELLRHAGRQFDPTVVRLFDEYWKRKMVK